VGFELHRADALRVRLRTLNRWVLAMQPFEPFDFPTTQSVPIGIYDFLARAARPRALILSCRPEVLSRARPSPGAS